MPIPDEIREALRTVQDPELMIGAVDLGLIYGIDCAGDHGEHVTVTMTLTSPMCPVGPEFKMAVESKAKSVDGVQSVKVDVTFTPPWDPRTMASEDAKFDLGIWF